MSESNYMIGIVTKDRYPSLKILLHSVRFKLDKVKVIDASDGDKIISIREQFPQVSEYFYNVPDQRKPVVHNKNLLIDRFLRYTNCDYLFLIEDDIKVFFFFLFERYIEISNKYNIPHMNFCGRTDINQQEVIYQINDDVQISEKLQGVFSFYTRSAIEQVGYMNPQLCHNCWEHIEYTARIHKQFNYTPQFYHFPDLNNSWEYIKMQNLPSVINNDKQHNQYVKKDKNIFLKSMGWNSLPYVDIKRFDVNKIKKL